MNERNANSDILYYNQGPPYNTLLYTYRYNFQVTISINFGNNTPFSDKTLLNKRHREILCFSWLVSTAAECEPQVPSPVFILHTGLREFVREFMFIFDCSAYVPKLVSSQRLKGVRKGERPWKNSERFDRSYTSGGTLFLATEFLAEQHKNLCSRSACPDQPTTSSQKFQ